MEELYLLVALIFALTLVLAYVVEQSLFRSRFAMRARLKMLERAQNPMQSQETMAQPFSQRVLKPILERVGARIKSWTPRSVTQNLDNKLIQAGYPYNLRSSTFLAVTVLITGVVTVATGSLLLLTELPVRQIILYTGGAFALGLLVPNLWLSIRAQSRIRQVDSDLPDAIDLLVVSVEAGLGFDMALAKVTEKMKGPLSEEFAKTLNEIRLGKVRKTALRDMCQRVESRMLTSFISTVLQGTQMGISMGNILRIQSESMRQERRYRAEEQAMKAPIKMLFPLVFFIFPALFVVILGPAAISLLRSL